VERVVASFWCCVGYASKGELVVGELEGANGQPVLENGSIVFDVVSMEGMKCTQF
jgi:hypothetical protein